MMCSFVTNMYNKIKNKIYSNYLKITYFITLYRSLSNPETTKTNTPSFVLSGSSASVSYLRLNKEYTLFVPYSRTKSLSMIEINAFLVKRGGEKVDITQQPGIPYLVSAYDMNAEKIILLNNKTGKSFDYLHKTMPLYGDELL